MFQAQRTGAQAEGRSTPAYWREGRKVRVAGTRSRGEGEGLGSEGEGRGRPKGARPVRALITLSANPMTDW